MKHAPWSGSLIKPSDQLIIVADGKDEIDEAVMRRARVGLENVIGYLDCGILAWNGAGQRQSREATQQSHRFASGSPR